MKKTYYVMDYQNGNKRIDREEVIRAEERNFILREGKTVNKQEVTAAIQEKHQEAIEKLNRLWEQYNKEFNENPRKCNKEEYVQKSEYLLGYCSGLMEVYRILVQDIK